jgi:hypothetical protein
MLVATYAGASQRIFSAGRRKAAGPPARSAKGQKVYGDLPGLLARAGPMPASGEQADRLIDRTITNAETAFGRSFCLDGASPSSVNFAAISAQLAKILFDPLLAVLERFVRCRRTAGNGDEKDQTTKEKSHPTDDQRHTQSTHIRNPKRDSLTWG